MHVSPIRLLSGIALAAAVALAAAPLAAPAQGAGAKKRLAPLSKADAAWTHGPFESGECGMCHQKGDASDPGPALAGGNQLCFDCHDDFPPRNPKKAAKAYHSGQKSCTSCHNPHNAKKKSLLL